ncbi:hypothetical protein [Sutcliffiella rhizosphaerae]|uniref:Uncharacterized protein n=1 Tax=Sutcliffiella rhizosphaerae TaxID=2880967 RepID=A0ABM8YMT3_9BACI|nr:hypothetical protein [Sutcliffiella rhizosphaerae]CAG9621260.1 hypothetical protein BACCIP111883_02032 [Sutcliffiella rhizosphaerae]
MPNHTPLALLQQEGSAEHVEKAIYPLDVEDKMEAIIGEPSVSGTFAAYFYKFEDHPAFLIQIHTQEFKKSPDDMMESLLPHKKYPATSYKSEEVKIGSYRGILTESYQEYGGINLIVVTENVLYSINPGVQNKNLTQAEKEQLKEDLVKLGNLLNY